MTLRLLWLSLGAVSLALGTIGILMPLLPTAPFFILATFCFARSSPRLHDWLINHRAFGPPIQNWQESGAISGRAKTYATVSILLVFGTSLILHVPWQLLTVQVIVLGLVLLFIWTRPEG